MLEFSTILLELGLILRFTANQKNEITSIEITDIHGNKLILK